METAIRLGVADAIADVVETGTTLRQAGLELFGDPILQSEAILIRRTRRRRRRPAWISCERRLNGVLVARNYVMMDYDVSDEVRRRGLRDHARVSSRRRCRRWPGRAGTPSGPWCRAAEAQQIMDDLWDGRAPGRSWSPTSPPAGSECPPTRGPSPGPDRRCCRPCRLRDRRDGRVALSCCAEPRSAGSPCRPRSGCCSRVSQLVTLLAILAVLIAGDRGRRPRATSGPTPTACGSATGCARHRCPGPGCTRSCCAAAIPGRCCC